MRRFLYVFTAALGLLVVVACGATPGITTTKKQLPNAPSYTYIDTIYVVYESVKFFFFGISA